MKYRFAALPAALLLGLANVLIALLWPEVPLQRAQSHELLLVVLAITAIAPALPLVVPGGSAKIVPWSDLGLILGLVVLAWQVLVGRTSWLAPYVFPSPARVFFDIQRDIGMLVKGLGSSLLLLSVGLGAAIVTAVPLGLAVGWYRRLSSAVLPIAKAVAPTPPTIYVPYAIALLPSFFSASALVIFIGSFWPLFVNTVQGVEAIDRRIIDSARTLCLKKRRFFAKILLPGAAPGIFTGIMLALVLSFIMLTIAEMIGATSGLGWYVQYFADFASYDRVVAGILFIGFVVSVLVGMYDAIRRRVLRWRGSGP